jgi:PAS domain S-box-containing protein
VKTALARITGVDLIAALYAIGFLLWLLARWLGVGPPGVGSVAFYPLGLIVAWANWRNSRAEGLDRRTRIAWQLLATASLVLWGAGSAWTLSLTTAGTNQYSAWIDAAVFGQDALAIAGYLCFPWRTLPQNSRMRFRFDAALVIVAGFVIASFFSLRLFLMDPAATTAAALVGSSLDWGLLAVAGVGMLQKRDHEIRRAMLLLVGANLAYLAGNSVFISLAAYHVGDPVDGLWFAAWALRWLAARQAWNRYAAVRAGRVPAKVDDRGYRSSPLSYVTVGGALALLLSRVVARDEAFLGTVAVAAMIMGALLVLRQFAEIEENRQLFRAHVAGEARFRSLVQNSSDVVLVVDPRGVITYVSPSVGRVFGEQAHIEVGVALRQLLPAEDAGTAVALLAGDSQAAPQFETRFQTAPGRWREVEVAWTDLRHDPTVAGIVVSCRDVTERHDFERYLRQTQELDAVGHFAGGMAHDLNNLLTVIRGYSELLQSEWPEDSSLGGDLDQVVAAVDRAASVTGKILAFSRKQPVRRKRLDLNAVIDDVRPMLRHVTREPVEIRLKLDPSLWPVRADQGQMAQVLVNLVSNAGDAMPQGGDIRIATGNRTVESPASATGDLPPGNYVALTVSDHGIGMGPELSARIFEPFFSTKPPGQGLGLGLAVVRGIVSDMDGQVRVESREGHGSTFTVLLPRAEEE